jgi:hypothetical protein
MATRPIKSTVTARTYATATVTTAADGLSDVIDLCGYSLCSIQMSTGWSTADMTFKGAVSSSASMGSIYKTTASVELTYVTSASYIHAVDPTELAGLRYVQLRSGTAAAAVAQAASRTVILGLAKLSD